jgi:hypothetical protein
MTTRNLTDVQSGFGVRELDNLDRIAKEKDDRIGSLTAALRKISSEADAADYHDADDCLARLQQCELIAELALVSDANVR